MENKWCIGCSGYYYPAWKNKFYPAGLQPKNWLEHYSTVFNTVELNSTFYRIPGLFSLQKYYNTTPPEFRFSVKMSKQITHILKLKESKSLITEFQALIREGLQEKCIHFLFQFQPSFQHSDENMELVLNNIPHTPENVIEFRHTSWWNDDVKRKLAAAEITFCNVDFPGLETSCIQPMCFTSDCMEIRCCSNHPTNLSNYKNSTKGFPKVPQKAAFISIILITKQDTKMPYK